jgi:thiol:disulfide interchange protein DsbA
MNVRHAFISVVWLALAACSQQPAATPPAPPADTSAAAPAAQSAPAAAPAPAPATPESAGAAKTPPTPPAEESKLEKVSPLPTAGQLPAGKWVAGTNYKVLMPAQPTDAPPGKVEVLEVFWYACPHCYALEPFLAAWLKHKAPYIEFRRVPVTWQPVHQSHARLFYALEALGKESALHADIFNEMHERKNYMFMQGNDAETLSAQVAFVKAHGISAADFTNAYNSFTVQTDLSKADDLVHRYHIDGVPTIIVNGKYMSDVNMAGNPASLVSLIDDLAASEKGR